MRKKSQIWSMDSVLSVVVFISAVSAFLLLVSSDLGTNDTEQLKSDSKKIPRMLTTSEELSIVEGNKVDKEKLRHLQNTDYSDLKSSMGVNGDFCIFFEDKEGNVINISEITGEGDDVGIGNSEVNVSQGIRCSS